MKRRVQKQRKKMIYQRISSLVEDILPSEQAEFRPHCGQVLTLTTHIESGFEKRLKTGVVLLDLTAAYDTVWTDGLIHKLYKVEPCMRIVSLSESMLTNKKFRVFVGRKSSKAKLSTIPQGGIISITLQVYTSDLPETLSRKFVYADDIALTFQHKEFHRLEEQLITFTQSTLVSFLTVRSPTSFTSKNYDKNGKQKTTFY
ncbi:putative RNA-directed DNA polymerase from transposon BS-like Protein [Tribolium castaneum]|uniref:Putative RNA-directed DNA polymerase from transposon BS-like Protein n=1 Tax=Tribolium castaneum TaxID=7070 RepID=D7EM34_TRICA|nr:putative RNA-directed DNA polymerase from transposon BS-like Protein [Tribolium castaneum]